MKFSEYWSEILSQNGALKWGLISVSVVTLLLGFSLVSLALRDPILIERECITRQIRPASAKVTVEEIERFARFVVPKRFDSDAADSSSFLTPAEAATRNKELDELTSKGMSQHIFVNSAKVDGSTVLVDADRLLSFGKLRSALPLALKLQLKTTDRTPGNPYGLLLEEASAIKEEGEKK